MKKNIILLSLTILMFSCVDKEKTLDNGVEIKYLKTGSASQIQEGGIVLLNLKYFDSVSYTHLTLPTTLVV